MWAPHRETAYRALCCSSLWSCCPMLYSFLLHPIRPPGHQHRLYIQHLALNSPSSSWGTSAERKLLRKSAGADNTPTAVIPTTSRSSWCVTVPTVSAPQSAPVFCIDQHPGILLTNILMDTSSEQGQHGPSSSGTPQAWTQPSVVQGELPPLSWSITACLLFWAH